MANEVTISGSLEYADSEGSDELFTLAEVMFSVTDKLFVRHKQAIGTTEEAIDLGGLATLGWAVFKNLSATNYVELRSATGAGNDIIKLPALGFAIFYFGSDVTAPFAIANTASCQLEYLICAI